MISLLLFAIAVTHAAVPEDTIVKTLDKSVPTLAKALNSSLPLLDQTQECECGAFTGYAVDAFKTYKNKADSCGSNTTCVDSVCQNAKTDASAKCMQFFYDSASNENKAIIDGLKTKCSAQKIDIVFGIGCNSTTTKKGFTVFAATTGNTPMYTVVKESYSGAQLVAGGRFHVTAYIDPKTKMEQSLQVVVNGSAVKLVVNFANQSLASVNNSIPCSNGFIHMLDSALVPPKSVSDTLKDLGQTALAGKFDLDSKAKVTVLVPTDNAVANFTQLGSLSTQGQGRVLETHEIQGVVYSSDLKNRSTETSLSKAPLRVHIDDGSVAFSVANQTAKSTVMKADVLTSSGVIHTINHVLVWESDPQLDPVDSIVVRPELSDFAEKILLVNATQDFKETLRKCAKCTVFAPTNDAFKGNLSGVDALAVLQYHVAKSAILSKDLKSLNRAESYLNNPAYVKLDGLSQSILITQVDDKEKKNHTYVRVQFGFPEKKEYATVVLADQKAANDTIIHEIDTILSIPANTTATATRGGFTTMVDLVTGLNLTHKLDDGYKKINNTGMKPYTLFVASNKRYNDADFEVTANTTSKVLNQATNGILSSVNLAYLANTKNKNGTRVGEAIVMLGGANYTVAFNNKSELTVGGHKVLQSNILTANGLVHVLDGVLGVENSNSSGLSAGVWAAIIVGGLAVLALLCYCFSQACKDDSTSAERRPFATLADQE
jgi:uncharacterized surface protein with fasciclin (FAS1) repeats